MIGLSHALVCSPFVDQSVLDGVRVSHELITDFAPKLLSQRKHYFPEAPSIDAPVDKDTATANGDMSRTASAMRLFNE